MEHKILHLCTDGNFIENSISVFEKYYSKQNIFCIKPKPGVRNASFVKNPNVLWFDPINDKHYIEKLEVLDKHECFDIVVVHGMSKSFNEILKRINANHTKRVFWLFWGYELYNSLGEEGKFPLIDDCGFFSISAWTTPTRYNNLVRKLLGKERFHKSLKEFLPLVDYFCFWLYEDYLLLQEYYPTPHLKYRYFTYSDSFEKDKEKTVSLYYPKKENEIRISHSASRSANHLTVMRILKQIDKDNVYIKTVPLSYGSNRVRKRVLRIGEKYFGSQFNPILEYVSRDEYYDSLSKVGVAIFGQLRQEAAGNIFPLIKSGAKVFLRSKNPLFLYCKRREYLVFSIEDDLKKLDDLKPLSQEQMIHNANMGLKNMTTNDEFMPRLFDD